MENKQLSILAKLRAFTSKKPIQYGLVLTYVAVILAVFIPHLIHKFPTFVDKKVIVDCKVPLNTFQVSISSLGFNPKKIETKVCDQIIFKNMGSSYHQIAFGPHPIHLIYPGFKEKVLVPGTTNTVLLKAYGTYQIHDHLHDNLEAQLIISK